MAFRKLGPDRLERELERILRALYDGAAPKSIESASVDIKEEPGRREPGGMIRPPQARNDKAAEYLTGELACMANTDGGGVIIVGLADDGQKIGTSLDPAWLRHRIFELSNRQLTVDIRTYELQETNLLLIRAPEAVAPIRWKGKVQWRVANNCVEVDPGTWHTDRLYRAGFDWSAQVSGYSLGEVHQAALQVARESVIDTAPELATASDSDFLTRLNVLQADGKLTNAGALLFVATPVPAIDYIRRDYPGADSTMRLEATGPLLTQLAEVEQLGMASNRMIHLEVRGFSRPIFRAIPQASLREVIVNGIVHRDWMSPSPTVVEFTDDTLTVTSPGGFMPGVSPENIITHPSTPRYRSLAQAMSDLNLAEREGIGIDRIVTSGLMYGYAPTVIEEVAGPSVRVVLQGGRPDPEWLAFLAELSPERIRKDLNTLLLLDRLTKKGWLDLRIAAATMQKSEMEARTTIELLLEGTLDGSPLIQVLQGTLASEQEAWRPSTAVRQKLPLRLAALLDSQRERIIGDFVRSRQKIATAEVADLVQISAPTAFKLLQELVSEGLLEPSRSNFKGPGFHFVRSD